MLQAGGAIGLYGRTGEFSPCGRRPPKTKITDLGPGLVQFALMSSVLVGDVIYIGTRNTLPTRVVAYHVPTRKVIGQQTDLTTGYAIQAIAADPTGRYLYAGVLQKSGGPQANLHRWDLSTPDQPAVPIGRIGDRGRPGHHGRAGRAWSSRSAAAARRPPRSGSTTLGPAR